MKEKEIAKKIYLDLKEFKKKGFEDSGLILFSIVKNMQSENIDKVYEEYVRILKKELLIIEVLSATSLSDKQREELEVGVRKKLDKDLVFEYVIDPKVRGGIIVRNGDDLIDLSLSKRISEIQI